MTPTGDRIIKCHRCGTNYYQVTGHKCREPQPLPAYEASRFISEHELIIDGIVAQCAEAALAQMSEQGVRGAFCYLNINETREIIRASILMALKRYQNVVVSCDMQAREPG